MLFNSFGYAVFLPVIFLLYWAVPRKWRWVLLFTSSYFFYASWGPEYILVLLLTTVISYYAALYMERAGKQRDKALDSRKGRRAASAAKTALVLSILFCAGLLFFFKYLNFFSENVAALLPIGVFLVIFLGSGIVTGDFYAMPAIVAALCIFSWALILSSPGSPLTDSARLSQISLAACSAMPSVKSLA